MVPEDGGKLCGPRGPVAVSRDVGAERAPGQGTPSGKDTVKMKVNSRHFPGEESWKDSSPGNPCDQKR